MSLFIKIMSTKPTKCHKVGDYILLKFHRHFQIMLFRVTWICCMIESL